MRPTTNRIATLATLAALAACSAQPDAARLPLQPDAVTANRSLGSDVNKDLAALRAVTAPFHQLETGVAAGWSTALTGCMDDPALGGMGYHYGNVGLIDGKVEVRAPEILVYEPEPNGRMRLVAVEYVMPLSASPTPPRLFERDFVPNKLFQLWTLHVWVWKHNASGMFAPWNPTVKCLPGTAMGGMKH